MFKLYCFIFLLYLPDLVLGQQTVSQKPSLAQQFPTTQEAEKEAIRLKKEASSAYKEGNYPEALDYYQKSFKIYQELRHRQGIAETLRKMGMIYNYQGKYPQALAIYEQSLRISQTIDDYAGIADCLNNIGGIYVNQGNLKKALDFFSKGLEINKKAGNQTGMARSLNNLGGIHSDQKNYDSAMFYFQEALEIEKINHTNYAVSSILNNIAEVYAQKGNEQKALEFYDKSDSAAHLSGDKITQIYAYLGIASTYQKLKNYAKSVSFAEKGFKKAQEMGALRELEFMSREISNIHKEQGNYEKALEYYEIYKQTNDSLFNIEKQKALRNLEIQGELDRKNREIAQEKINNYQQKIINYCTLAGLILAILLLFMILRAKNKQQKAKEIISKQKEALTENHEKLRHTNHELEKTIENLHKTQAHLVQSEKTAAFGLLMATISHEINNPANYIKGSSDFLEESINTLWDYIRKIQKTGDLDEIKNLYEKMKLDEIREDTQVLMGDFRLGVDRIIEIVRNLKTFIRLDEQGAKQANLSKNFEAILNVLRSRFLGKIEIETNFEPNLPLIHCHISQINQVFLALLLNAIEAIENKGTIKVATFQDDLFLIFSISDSGCGIPETIKSRIFEAFVSGKSKSAGLGLYIVKEIVEEHRGKIQFESSEKGTIFSIFLPKN